MIPAIRILEPVSCGERIFYPLVQDSMVSCEHGVTVMMNPVALEEGIIPEILENLSLTSDHEKEKTVSN
jgi:hypothetical protein